jgi:SOS-response transcriptional repressor LexA
MNGLSPRQAEIYEFIETYHRQRSICPSFRDIAAATGLALSTVAAHMNALRRKGYITWDAHVVRSVRILM